MHIVPVQEAIERLRQNAMSLEIMETECETDRGWMTLKDQIHAFDLVCHHNLNQRERYPGSYDRARGSDPSVDKGDESVLNLICRLNRLSNSNQTIIKDTRKLEETVVHTYFLLEQVLENTAEIEHIKEELLENGGAFKRIDYQDTVEPGVAGSSFEEIEPGLSNFFKNYAV
jgi:hypothetical protein